MKLEQQVCSLELAKKLKELGVIQESIFLWETGAIKPRIKLSFEDKENLGLMNITRVDTSDFREYCSAFTVAELGEMLPNTIYLNDEGCGLEITHHLEVVYRSYSLGKRRITREASTEADARAKMLIYLLENKLITP